MLTKAELALEQSQQGASDDVLLVGIKSLLDAVRITATQVYVNTALMKLVLLMNLMKIFLVTTAGTKVNAASKSGSQLVGIKSLLDAVRITATQVYVNTALMNMRLQLLQPKRIKEVVKLRASFAQPQPEYGSVFRQRHSVQVFEQ
nr:hypothetical protein [Tanacetum cinerariifolium]